MYTEAVPQVVCVCVCVGMGGEHYLPAWSHNLIEDLFSIKTSWGPGDPHL